MRETRPDQPEIDPEAVGETTSEEHISQERKERDGFLRYIGTQVGMWTLVAVLSVIALIAIIVFANIY